MNLPANTTLQNGRYRIIRFIGNSRFESSKTLVSKKMSGSIFLIIGIVIVVLVMTSCQEGRNSKTSISSKDVPSTKVVSEEEQRKIAESLKPTGHHISRGYVDLDLPSGVLWATCNVGADKYEDLGNSYEWGSTIAYSKDKSYYETRLGRRQSSKDISGDSNYDIARKSWGGEWRMPTLKEMEELINNCIWTWDTQNGQNGRRVTSKKNGKSIFLPAASRWDNEPGLDGYYWTSTPHEDNDEDVYFLGFYAKGYSVSYTIYLENYTIRPVVELK